MRKVPWLVFGALGVGAILAGACGGDDDGGSGSDGDTTSGGGTTSSTTSPNNTSNNTVGGTNSTTGRPTTTTTGSSTTTGAAGGGSGGEGGGAGGGGEGGMGGEAPARPSCTEIPSRAFEADGVDADDFSISSPEFDNCEPMPANTTCEGKLFPKSESPELTWTEGPEGTLSYAISFTDVTILETRDPGDPTYNQGYHYVIWDIPADTLSLPAELGSGFEVDEIEGALQWAPFNDYGYMGPCANFPNPETGEVPEVINDDSYSFTIYALDVVSLPIPGPVEGRSFPRVMDDLLKETALAAVEYRGTSNALASSAEGVFPPMFDVPCPAEGEQPEGCLSADE